MGRLGIVMLLSVAGCASHGGRPPMQEAGWRVCIDPRPEVCTREYRPVCARLDQGGRRTYASACTACADVRVRGYRPGGCERTGGAGRESATPVDRGDDGL